MKVTIDRDGCIQCGACEQACGDGRTLVLYCGSAWRSALSAAALHDMGRTDVTHLEGGFSAWSSAGLPVAPYPERS